MSSRVASLSLWLLLAGLLLLPGLAEAQTFSSGSTGADGPFAPPTTVPPGTIVSGSTVTVPLPPGGIFNFTTVNIPVDVTVKFVRNAANTPIILLATGDVIIAGTIDVSGGDASGVTRPGVAGPGGFEGGRGADGVSVAQGSPGLGLGGGKSGNGAYAGGGGGGYGTSGGGGSACSTCDPGSYGTPGGGGLVYGSEALQPLVGGSGGGGGGGIPATFPQASGGGGGGGGGAILIASSSSIALTGFPAIQAIGGRGGFGSSTNGGGGGGAGGAIRLVAPLMTGNGQLFANGAQGAAPDGGLAGAGRIRLEASTSTFRGFTNPLSTTSLPQPVFPPTGQPSLRIARVGGVPAPAAPAGSILAAPDILLPVGTTNPLEVVLAATNIPLGTTILVTATPQSGGQTSALSSGLSGTLPSSTATASLTLNLSQVSVLTATATFPLVASAGGGPVYAEGEEVTHMRVAAVLGGATQVTYITRSGREIIAQ